MITLSWWDDSPEGLECSIYGSGGRYKLFVGDRTDPSIEGSDPHELDREARRRGASSVIHYYGQW